MVNPKAMPEFHYHRPVPFALKEKVEASLSSQVAAGEFIPVEQSEWAVPIVVVNKKDGGIRICGDFKVSVNPVIFPQVYSLPTPEEIFSTLGIFLQIGPHTGIQINERSQHLLTINTHIGLFNYSTLPFGITTAPALWQKAMAQMLQ